MSSSTPTPSCSRLRTGGALLAVLAVLAVLAGLARPADAARPQATATPAGTLDGRSRLTVDLPGEDKAPGSVTLTVGGAQQAAQVVPALSDRAGMVVVVDASASGAGARSCSPG